MRSILFAAAVVLGTAFAAPASAHESHHGHEPSETTASSKPDSTGATSRPAVSESALLRMHLTQPEYWHVLIHPFPILGMALAVPLLLFALAVRSRGAHEAGLVLILLSALGAFATVKVGQRAYDRVYKGI
ncbi:MAG: hypothetical protein HYZ74_06610, partial [Elusimicrobia bacterium]|nr:hypothetical protein [Elusimicrobiota bacterium]